MFRNSFPVLQLSKNCQAFIYLSAVDPLLSDQQACNLYFSVTSLVGIGFMMEIMELLGAVELFDGLGEGDLEQVASLCSRRKYKNGDSIQYCIYTFSKLFFRMNIFHHHSGCVLCLLRICCVFLKLWLVAEQWPTIAKTRQRIVNS